MSHVRNVSVEMGRNRNKPDGSPLTSCTNMLTSRLPLTSGRTPQRRKYCEGHRSERKCHQKINREYPSPPSPSKSSIRRRTTSPPDLRSPAMCLWMLMRQSLEDPSLPKKGGDYSKKIDVSTAATKDIAQIDVGRSQIVNGAPLPSQKRQIHFTSEL